MKYKLTDVVIERLRKEMKEARDNSRSIDLSNEDKAWWLGYSQAIAHTLAYLRREEP